MTFKIEGEMILQAGKYIILQDEAGNHIKSSDIANVVQDVSHSSFHKPKKKYYTSILEFEVVKPEHDFDTVGERLKLSMFGEYCPDNSLRGYELEELLMKPEYYRPKVIVQMGKTVSLNYA